MMPNMLGPKLDWVIAGGESGPEARLMKSVWINDLASQCAWAGTPFWFKQWGDSKRTGDDLGFAVEFGYDSDEHRGGDYLYRYSLDCHELPGGVDE